MRVGGVRELRAVPYRNLDVRWPWRRSRARRCSLRCLLLLLLCPFALWIIRLRFEREGGGGVTIPLWKLSSIGGIIFRTFSRVALVDWDILGASDDIWRYRESGSCGVELQWREN